MQKLNEIVSYHVHTSVGLICIKETTVISLIKSVLQIYLSVIRFSALIVGAHGCYGIFTLPCEQLDYDRKKKTTNKHKNKKKQTKNPIA